MKVFKKGTATTRLQLPGFARSQQDFLFPRDSSELCSERVQRGSATRQSVSGRPERHSSVTSPIYDAVYEEDPSTTYKSTTELVGSRHRSTAAQWNDDFGKSYSLQDLKLRTGFGDAVPAGGKYTSTRTEHAIDDDEIRNCTENIIPVRGDDGSGSAPISKSVKTVTFRDDVKAAVVQRLESGQGPGRTETSMDTKDSVDSDVLSGKTLPLAFSRTLPPVAGHLSLNRCVKMTKSSSLPVRPRESRGTGDSSSVKFRDKMSSVRDTITSCDLEELPKYLADMYRQQKLERQREQELAVRERERLHGIEKMWKEFENHLTISSDGASCSKSSVNAEPCVSHVAQTVQRKPIQQVLMQFLCSNC